MRPINFDQMLSVSDWERVRPVMRQLFINEKERRRFTVGGHFTFLFENPQTVWYQVAEMIRVEKIVNPKMVQEELDTYNELLPRGSEITATLLIEYPNEQERDEALRALKGIQEHLWLRLGERRVLAKFDDRQIADEVAISSVQFVRFPIAPSDVDALTTLAQSGQLAIEIDHPAFLAGATLSVDLARALAQDLR
jgi:Protein of unknown function (DUF3501)